MRSSLRSGFLAAGAINCALIAFLPQATSRLADRTPVVGVVSQSGQLLPLAVHDGRDWQYLDSWPMQDTANDPDSPPWVPGSVTTIPRDWLGPLGALPQTWRFEPVNGQSRDIYLREPALWDDATFASVGIGVDYKSSDPVGTENDVAGIAVAGDVSALPVRQLDASSVEWQRIVKAHVSNFVAAERVFIRKTGARAVIPSNAQLARQLQTGEVNLAEVRVGEDLTYSYFDTFLIRPSTRESRAANCGDTSAIHVGLLVRRGQGPSTLKWIKARYQMCSDLTPGMTVIGGVQSRAGIRFVVKRGWDDWADFAVVDPAATPEKFLPPYEPGR